MKPVRCSRNSNVIRIKLSHTQPYFLKFSPNTCTDQCNIFLKIYLHQLAEFYYLELQGEFSNIQLHNGAPMPSVSLQIVYQLRHIQLQLQQNKYNYLVTFMLFLHKTHCYFQFVNIRLGLLLHSARENRCDSYKSQMTVFY